MKAFFRHIKGAAPSYSVALTMAVAVIASSGLPHLAPYNSVAAKRDLMSQLPNLVAVSCGPGALYLFSGGEPIMAVWMASEPAELYTVDGRFAGALSAGELHTLIDATLPFDDNCHTSDVDDGAPQFNL